MADESDTPGKRVIRLLARRRLLVALGLAGGLSALAAAIDESAEIAEGRKHKKRKPKKHRPRKTPTPRPTRTPRPAPTPTATPAPTPSPVSGGNGRVLGYYVGYAVEMMPPAEIEWSGLTHIAMGAVHPIANGSLDLSFYQGNANQGKNLAKDIAQRAHAHGVTPILMIGGAGSGDAFRSAAKPANRATLVANLLAAMNDLGYDGLDLDWEPLETADAADFEALVIALRAAAPDAVLTFPAGYTTKTFPDVPAVYARVAPYLDQISIMTYGMEGPWDGWRSWHSSALFGEKANTPTSVSMTVGHFLAAGIPAAKLAVGIGFYGDCWKAPVAGPSQAIGGSDIVATDFDMPYNRIVQTYAPLMTAAYDDTAKVPYLSSTSGAGAKKCTYITYENAASIAAKGAWARQQGLAGAIIWNINQGHLNGKDDLLKATKAAFAD